MKMDSKVYDVLKFVAQVIIPALATLYFAIAQVWGISDTIYAEQVVGTLSAIDVFLGAILGISSMQYYKEHK